MLAFLNKARTDLKKSFLLTILLSLILSGLSINQTFATTYVTVSVKFSDDAGNIPLEGSFAEASNANGQNISSSDYKNGAFNLNIPQGSKVRLRLAFIFNQTSGLERIDIRTKVPYFELNSMSEISFDKDTELQVKLASPQVYKIAVTDAQLNPLKNVLIADNYQSGVPVSLSGLSWSMGQRQSIPGNPYYVFSQSGLFQIAYYSIPKLGVRFSYWETGNERPPTIGGIRVDTPSFFLEDFRDIYLCTPVNFDSTKTTNKNCFENLLAVKNAERAAQEAAVRAAAEKAAAEKAAIAAAERKAARDQASAKKTTITCVKGKVSKKVTAVKPRCPSGYKLKN